MRKLCIKQLIINYRLGKSAGKISINVRYQVIIVMCYQ